MLLWYRINVLNFLFYFLGKLRYSRKHFWVPGYEVISLSLSFSLFFHPPSSLSFFIYFFPSLFSFSFSNSLFLYPLYLSCFSFSLCFISFALLSLILSPIVFFLSLILFASLQIIIFRIFYFFSFLFFCLSSFLHFLAWRGSYHVPKKFCPILYSNFLYKMDQDLLDTQYTKLQTSWPCVCTFLDANEFTFLFPYWCGSGSRRINFMFGLRIQISFFILIGFLYGKNADPLDFFVHLCFFFTGLISICAKGWIRIRKK